MKVYIIILNWNGWRDTLECLESLKTLTYDNHEIVVVDNASTDGSEQKIREAHPNLTLIQSGANLGFAGGNNVGIEYALLHDADFVWLLNNDTVVEPDALTHLVARMAKDTNVGMCGSTLVYYDRSEIQALAGARFNKWLGTFKIINRGVSREPSFNADDAEWVEKQLDCVIGASMLISRRFVESVGLLAEDYFLYNEEIDWAIRAKNLYTLAYAAKSVVYHKEGTSTGGSNFKLAGKSRISDFYMVKSRIMFARKFYPYTLPTVYLGLGVTMVNRIRRGQWGRLKMILKLALSRNLESEKIAE